MSTISPNMGLLISTVGIDSGLLWEQNLNASLTTLDGHNHSAGNGVQIQPSGLNITSALSFNNNSAINLSASTYTAQASPPANQSVYVSGVDLWYADGAGNQIQITTGGGINATSSGISSGTASASFVSGVLVVNSAATTPANIKAGSILIGNNTAGSNYLTLAPPNAMPANYTLTLPSIPGSSSFLGIDTSGNISGIANVSGGITGSNIASATITGSNIAASTITASNISTVNSSSLIFGPGFRVTNSATTTQTAGSFNTMFWNATTYVAGASPAPTATYSIPISGKYRLTVMAQLNNCLSGQQATIWANINGTLVSGVGFGTVVTSAQNNTILGSTVLPFTASDNLTLLLIYTSDPSNRALSGDARFNWWTLEFLGA